MSSSPKPWIGLWCAGLLAATLAPIAQNWSEDPSDGFPFSYYPMFSRALGETYRVTHVVGIDRDGREHVVPHRYLGKGGLNEVRVFAQRAARSNPERFCAAVASALRNGPPEELGGVQELAVRSGAYAIEPFYAGRIEARHQEEHARCSVRR